MQQLSAEYLVLFNAITDAEMILKNLHSALITAQQTAEEIYISAGDLVFPFEKPADNTRPIDEEAAVIIKD
jgi:hypothetical protein